MSDQTPDPTAWSDDQLDNLLDRLVERAAERDDLDLPGGSISRRTALAGALGMAGIGGLISTASAAPSYGAATGTIGTNSDPLSQATAQTGQFQDLVVDRAATVGSRDLYTELGRQSTTSGSSLSVSSVGAADLFMIEYEADIDGSGDVKLRFNGDSSGNNLYAHTLNDGTVSDDNDSFLLGTSPNKDFGVVAGRLVVPKQIQSLTWSHEPAHRPSRVPITTVYGERDNGNPISAVEIFFTGNGFRNASLRVYGATR